jgi:hypothetical protein
MKTLLQLVAAVSILLSTFVLNTLTKEPITNPTRNSILPQLVIPAPAYESQIRKTVSEKFEQGRHIFRFDTFGDQAFWGDMLRLHEAIEGARFGGVGAGLSPRNALALGLKIDLNALPEPLRANISETPVVLLINEQGEKEKGRDEREFSWCSFLGGFGWRGTERRRAKRAAAQWSGSQSGRRLSAGLAS